MGIESEFNVTSDAGPLPATAEDCAIPFNAFGWPKTCIVEAELTLLNLLTDAEVAELGNRLRRSGEKSANILVRYVRLGLDADNERERVDHSAVEPQ